MEEPKEDSDRKSKAIRLVEFLSRIAQLRTKLVRDLSDYTRVFWIDDIPKNNRACFTRAWGADDHVESDVWIEVQK